MNKLQPLALLASGKVTRSFLLSIPGVRERIGPVKASSLRVASRIARTIQAGFPVAGCAEFENCPAVFLCIPDEVLPATVQELIDSRIDWAGRTVVLCDSAHTTAALGRLAAFGAYPASLTATRDSGTILLAEGHRSAIANLKAVLGRPAHLIRIETHQKATYFRALQIASLSGPLAAIAGERLRESGLTPAESKRLVQAIFHSAVRDYMKAGRKVLSTSGDVSGIAALRRALNTVGL